MELNLIEIVDAEMGLGVGERIDVYLSKDKAHFKRMTTGTRIDGKQNVVVMDATVFESIPDRFKPLKDRRNVVIKEAIEEHNNNEDLEKLGDNVVLLKSWNEAMDYLQKPEVLAATNEVWVAGGKKLYELAINSGHCHRIYLTKLVDVLNCETRFDFDLSDFELVTDERVSQAEQAEGGIRYYFLVYEKKRI